MSQQIVLSQIPVPAHIAALRIPADQLKAMNAAAALGTGGGGGVNKIGLKQSRFRLQPAGGNEVVLSALALQVAVVRVNDGINKTWYEKAYNPDVEAGMPECSSDDGIAPRIDSPKRQCDTCAACPHNVFGSSINPLNGAKGKSCMDTKRMAIMPPAAGGRFTKADADVYQLSVPPASLKDFGAFVRGLNGMATPSAYNMVVVEVAFDTQAQYPKLTFKAVRWLEADEYDVVNGRYDQDEVKRTAGLPEMQTYQVGTQQAAQQQPIPGNQPAQQSNAQQNTQQAAQQPAQQAAQQPAQQASDDGWGGGQPVQQNTQQQPATNQQEAGGDDEWGGGQVVNQQADTQQPVANQQAAQQTNTQQSAHQNPQTQGPTGGRERGKPAPGKTRRNAQEMAEDNAADERDRLAGGGQGMQTNTQQTNVQQGVQQNTQQAAQQPAGDDGWGGGEPVQQATQQQVNNQQQAGGDEWGGGQAVSQQADQTGAPNQPNVLDGSAAAGAFANWDD